MMTAGTRDQEPSVNPPVSLAFYHDVGCPYCVLVQRVIDDLDVQVEYRDIYRHPEHRQALLDARGRKTVPVLAITDAAGEVTWMPESGDIAAWLRAREADGTLERQALTRASAR